MPPRPLPGWRSLPVRDIISVAVAGQRGRPLRAALSALGIAIGIAAMVTVLGVTRTSEQQLLDQIQRLGTNLLTAHTGTDFFGTPTPLSNDAPGMVRRIPSVRSVSAVGAVNHATVRRTDQVPSEETNGIAVLATRLDLLGTLSGTVRRGAFLNDATARYPAAVLGAVAAQRLGTRVGDQLYLGGYWFSVVGVLDPLPLAPEIDRAVLVGWAAAQNLLGFDGHPTTVYLRTADDEVQQVWNLLAATVNPQSPQSVQVSRPSDALTAQLAAKSTFNGLFLGLGLVALLVGGIGVANTMVISVLERRSEIGLRRALGASGGQIRTQFFVESVMVALLGGVLGVVTGTGITLGYASTRGWPLVLPVTALGAGALAATAVGALAGLYPAVRAARLAPVQALATT
ncbi:MAG TPA: ABC transporter permease [Rugosimonospora sp.]|nr:ABC transporter permease [Rugosimonospora sp.]